MVSETIRSSKKAALHLRKSYTDPNGPANLMSSSQLSVLAPAVLGSSVTIKGEIHSREPLVIEGEVEGSIVALGHRITIAANGRVRANVAAREIEVHGCFAGQAEASELIRLGHGAEFVGDISAGTIVIEDGAFIIGNVELSSGDGRGK